MRLRGVSSRPPDIYVNTVRQGRHDAAPCEKLSIWKLRGPVYGNAASDIELINNIIFREGLCAASPLARRLKEKDDPLLQLVAVS